MGKVRAGVLAAAIVLGLAIGGGLAFTNARGGLPNVAIATPNVAVPTSSATAPSPEPPETPEPTDDKGMDGEDDSVETPSDDMIDVATLPSFKAKWETGSPGYTETLTCASPDISDVISARKVDKAERLMAMQDGRPEARLEWRSLLYPSADAAKDAYVKIREMLRQCTGTVMAVDPQPQEDLAEISGESLKLDRFAWVFVFYNDDDQCTYGCDDDGWWNDQLVGIAGDRVVLVSYAYVTDNCIPERCDPLEPAQQKWRDRVEAAIRAAVDHALEV